MLGLGEWLIDDILMRGVEKALETLLLKDVKKLFIRDQATEGCCF